MQAQIACSGVGSEMRLLKQRPQGLRLTEKRKEGVRLEQRHKAEEISAMSTQWEQLHV